MEDDNYIDIDGTIEALRTAWKIVPHMELGELLDTVTTMPFVELTNEEFRAELNEFILQNQ